MASIEGERLRIMCIDDYQIYLDNLQDLSGLSRHDLIGFNAPGEAIEELKSNPGRYDGMMVDLYMPGLDGAEVVRQVREFDQNLPIVMMSASLPEDLSEIARIGVDRFFSKDGDLDVLFNLLNHMPQIRAEREGRPQ